VKKPSLSFIGAGAAVALLFIFAYASGSLGRLFSTIVTTLIAISVVGGIWLVSNFVLSQARNRWSLYLGLSWSIVAAIFFGAMRGNQVITALFVDQDPIAYGAGAGFFGHIEWPLVGALIWGGGAALMSLLPNRLARVPIGIAMGVATGWLVAGHSLIWQRPELNWGPAILWILIAIAVALLFSYRILPPSPAILDRFGRRDSPAEPSYQSWSRSNHDPIPAIIVGAAAGWIFSVWLRADFVPSFDAPYIAAIVPMALIGSRMGWKDRPTIDRVAALEERGRAVIFLGPAILFLLAALVIPALGTIRLSFLDRDGQESVGWDNFRTFINDNDSFDTSQWTKIFGSQLFWLAVALIAGGALIGTLVGTKRNGELAFDRSGASVGSIGVGSFVFLTAAFAVLRGTFFNNLWWIVTVTVMSVILGLLAAVLAEGAGRFESVAKSFIFMPLAVSFVGASIVWRLQYQARPTSKNQTGLLNYSWIRLGELSHSGAPRTIVLLLFAALVARLGWHIIQRRSRGVSFTAPIISILLALYLGYQLLQRSLGGFSIGADGEVGPEFVLFLQNPPFNNVFLMIILVWIQTGFAMVILSAAIKSVPSEYVEAAKVDGATESQTFFNIVLPTILPTIGVVATTLIVLVTKVFDIVKVTTNGNFGTNVLANDFFSERFNNFDNGLGSAIATIILLMVLPVMILNVRRMQQARND
jgi:alpha-glucoside transport system permease protein